MSESKVAIVTAAGRGIGAGAARELAAADYRVVLMSRSDDAEQLAAELGGTGLRGSVTEEADLQRLVETALGTYNRIDAVVNNTGHPAKGKLLDITDREWHEGLDLLLLNVIRLARIVTPHMVRQGGGSIVNVSSFTAVEPTPSRPVSSALRASLSSFTKMYADEYAAAGVRMNSVLLGYVDSYEINEETRRQIPANRAATVSETAKAIRFLLSDDARYITGQNVRIDGGLTRSL